MSSSPNPDDISHLVAITHEWAFIVAPGVTLVWAAMLTAKVVKGFALAAKVTGKAAMGGARFLRSAWQHRPRLVE